MPWVSLQFVIVVFPDYTHLLFSVQILLTRSVRQGHFCATRTTMVEDNIEKGGGFVIMEFSGHTHLLLKISNKFTSVKHVLIPCRKVRHNSKIESCLGCI